VRDLGINNRRLYWLFICPCAEDAKCFVQKYFHASRISGAIHFYPPDVKVESL
jgi:hypothetical protein